MLKRNEKGAVDLMLVVALVIAAAVAGLVYWRINSVDLPEVDDTQPVAQEQETDQEETQEESDKEVYTHPQLKFTAELPDGWEFSKQEPDQYNKYESISVLSPDYKKEKADTAYGSGIEKGAAFGINCRDIRKGQSGYADDPTVEEILANNLPTPSIYDGVTEINEVSVDGQKAAQYKLGYEGPEGLVTEFDVDNTSCKVSNTDTDSPDFDLYIQTYLDFVKSIDLP